MQGNYLPNSDTYVYKKDNKVVAFVSVVDDSFIGALFVDTAYQGQGIGKQLVDYCKSTYANLELMVYTRNIPAIRFYEKCGFTVQGEQENPSSGYAEYLMEWDA